MLAPRQTAFFPLPENLPLFKRQMLYWASGQQQAVYLDSNGRGLTAGAGISSEWECLAAAGAVDILELNAGHAFETLKQFQASKHDWLFGFMGYDLKNEVEALSSKHFDGVGLPDLAFFQAETIVGIRAGKIEVHTHSAAPNHIFDAICRLSIAPPLVQEQPIHLRPRLSQAEYLHLVEGIRQHILGGDLYEMNFCQEFYAVQTLRDPVATFERLNALTSAPFAAFMRWGDRYLLCGSPERFLKKEGDQLLSQPIKGTRPRGATPEADEAFREDLLHSEKDRSENVMIVDLVRNDFAHHCIPGSVVVDELFGVYSFATVHQMISTIRGQLPATVHPLDALRDAFPMGSMTGAPKVMAMKLTEQYERTRRGLYAGALGYITPAGDFDFNVVIRSILYNAAAPYLSVQVGGAITHQSVPEQEYEECLVKLGAMQRALCSSLSKGE